MKSSEKVFGSLSQKELVEMYTKYVCAPKAEFFQRLGLGLVQGKRYGIYIEMLEGIEEGAPPLKLIDCHTSGGVKNLGSHHPEIDKALKEGLEKGLDIGDHHLLSEQRALLGKKMAKLLPGDISKTMFSVGGGEAIDLAIKLARGYTKRTKIISAARAYHGVTGFALGACASNFREPFLWDLPAYQQVKFGDIDDLKKKISEDTAAVIFETIPATGGILIPEKGYFEEVRELCDENGAIFIIDEVQTGLGRTGQMWGIYGGLYSDEKVVPDIMVLAKGMSAGVYPLSTTSYRPFLEEVFEEDPFLHISTTGGSELGCFVTRKMLDIISEPSFLQHVKDIGSYFEEGLRRLTEKYEKIVEIRGRGLMWGVEFQDEFTSLYFTLSMIKNGVWCDYCGNFKEVNKFLPPLIITEEEIQILLERMEKTLKEIS
ncbi:MAG: class-III pyridoxal-phosphate-dependent aminotransferase [Candidatus Hodarchaeales archaeon]